MLLRRGDVSTSLNHLFVAHDCLCNIFAIIVGRPRRRWEDNTKKDLQEVVCGAIDWIELALDRDRWYELVNAVMNVLVP